MFGSVVLAAIATLASAAETPAALTTMDIRRNVAADGALATVQALSRAGRWVIVENGVASGDPDWVALAPLVAPGTNAGTSEGLSIALADALPKAPGAVLAVVTIDGGGPLGVARVCDAPFIEDSPAHHAAYVQATLEALDHPTPAAVRAAGEACIARLRLAK